MTVDKLAVVDPFVVVNCLLSYSKRTKAARKFRFWNTQFSALRVPRSIESHQVNTTCLIISVLWLLSPELVYRVNFNDSYIFIVISETFSHEKGKLVEQKEELHLWVSIWNLLASRNVTPWKYRFSMFCTCYFVALMTFVS